MDSQGNLRELQPQERPKLDEIVIAAKEVEAVRAMTRQQRRAFYREEVKRLTQSHRHGR